MRESSGKDRGATGGMLILFFVS